MVKVLHTSDWHLGAQLYEKDRLDEQKLFLSWLHGVIEKEKIHALVVSGDVFDNYVPSVQAQALYYEFLAGLLVLEARPEIFIIAGNHDSPQFLNAPGALLSHLNIHIVSEISADKPDGEIFEIRDEKEKPLLALCTVPFLRERDLKLIADLGAGDDPFRKYQEAAAAYYTRMIARAKNKMPGLPVLVMSHLFLEGSVLSDDTSERFREVGRLSSMPAELLPRADYYALGHLHRPQNIGGMEYCRYSGSPIAMSFSEAGQQKSVVIAEFENEACGHDLSRPAELQINLLEIPQWQKLERITGDTQSIRKRLDEIKAANEKVLLEIQVVSCAGAILDFQAEIDGLRAEILEKRYNFSILASRDMRNPLQNVTAGEAFTEVASLRPMDVFERKLEAEEITGAEKETFSAMFKEIEELIRSGEAEGGETEA
jgi:exonuclease SbcD